MKLEVQILVNRAGLPADHVAYRYFCDAVYLYVEDNSSIRRMTYGIYPQIAEKRGVSPYAVQKAMDRAMPQMRRTRSFNTFFSKLGILDGTAIDAKRFIILIGDYYMANRLRIAPWDEDKFNI